jgi:hypothetical protein
MLVKGNVASTKGGDRLIITVVGDRYIMAKVLVNKVFYRNTTFAYTREGLWVGNEIVDEFHGHIVMPPFINVQRLKELV